MSSQFSQYSSLWQPLGSGIHSVVWRARKMMTPLPKSSDDTLKPSGAALDPMDELSQWVAVKVVYDNQIMPPHNIVREAAILQAISHPNIISFVAFILGGREAPYTLYMPLIPLSLTVLLSSPLFTSSPLTGPYSVLSRPVFAAHEGPDGISPFAVVAKSLVYQLVLATAYLHSLDPPVAHRDINPGNVLIDRDGTVKLIDFGIAWAPGYAQSAPSESTQSRSHHHFDGWTETEDKMCCEVSTGPYRAPELLFSPRSYSAIATDLWGLGATIAQFFTPLQLIPSHSPMSSPTSSSSSTASDEVHSSSRPFLIPPSLRTKIDYRATWKRLPLFTGDWGEIRLVSSIFKLRGTPNEETWPSFNALPDANKIEFQVTGRKPLHTALPHLSLSQVPSNSIGDASVSRTQSDESPVSLIDSFLTYSPECRLSAVEALSHPWFAAEFLPLVYPGSGSTHGQSADERTQKQTRYWGGRTLGEWLEPILTREAVSMTGDRPQIH